MIKGLPKKQGLYDPKLEHDACGIGFVVNIKGIKSHKIIEQALTILINLKHRGGSGSEPNTGDGAGILIQIPHKYFMNKCKSLDIDLPEAGEYGVGMVFLPTDEQKRTKMETYIKEIIQKEGQNFLGFVSPDTNHSTLGNTAISAMPHIRQVFIGKSPEIKDYASFEKKLYIIRKQIEKFALNNDEYVYFPSLSSKTIVYKGMLTSEQVGLFYSELSHHDVESALALVHSRYSTNTFPSWERAHPNRYIVHNGEINTLCGNLNRMNSRQSLFESEDFGDDIKKVLPIINPQGSDSAMFDECLEFMNLSGRSLPHSIMMMIPEPWSKHQSMDDDKKAFYEYHSCLMEPWDGPAAVAFTDGVRVGAVLDRNGLRPSRYYVTEDDMVILASEVGVLDIEPDKVILKNRLHPGKMLLIDTSEGKIISDDQIKNSIVKNNPYRQWLNKYLLSIDDLPHASFDSPPDYNTLIQRQKALGYTYEDLRLTIGPMAKDGEDPLGSMGTDIPLAVLSHKPQILYNYFKQLFAQVTNPPIDAIREEIVTSTDVYIGSEGSLIKPSEKSCRQIKINTPILDNGQMAKLKNLTSEDFKCSTISILYNPYCAQNALENALDSLFESCSKAISEGSNIIVLSDKGMDKENVAIPALLAVSGVHHHLIKEGTRTKVSIIVESGEPREVHHFCLLVGYGASAINPYLAFESIHYMIENNLLTDIDYSKAVKGYIKASTKGIVKVLSKMGISTIQSYQGAQIFEAIGLNKDLVDKYFTSTASRIEGINIEDLARETELRHMSSYNLRNSEVLTLDTGGVNQWRVDGEYHLFNPESIHKLQYACRTSNYNLFKEYSQLINDQTQKLCTIRGLLEFKKSNPIPIDEVESVQSICKRFKTGAMSYGSISKEAHETLAIAMNRIGGKSNTGEGGEDPSRFFPDVNGDSRCSAIKQVASGRFGVTSNYLVNANEIQIKMAQGAKPGEGGQLPGNKVYPWIAKVRGSTPGVGLISPPPHHDIYSIEDLAELIHDLKNANPRARINVKLVSEVGVGTIAAGVAKGKADVVLISGYDGGTGASPRTSIKHAGLPWELGLSETHQTLILNDLRSRIVVETDGKLLTGRDVAIAALLGAEEFGFATGPLITLGCIMMRVCNLDTCPVGVATQNPELRKNFSGKPEYVVNFFEFIAQQLREIMADLGFRTVQEMIGRSDLLESSKAIKHWKTKGIDLSNILYRPSISKDVSTYCTISQQHELDKSLDVLELLNICKPAIEEGKSVSATLPVKNINRAVGTITGSEISKKYGEAGLPSDTIKLQFRGSAGQSFGAFIPNGMTLTLEGDSNDYLGKGLSGGKIIVYPPKESKFKAEENIITGNVAFYGATSGEAYIRGVAGERFCVRNSGVNAVVEGVGDHGCEYMTGGCVVILGSTGRNFAAGMSGGIAYVYSEKSEFLKNCNTQMVSIEELSDDDEILILKDMIERHFFYTNSHLASQILSNWDMVSSMFIKVIPNDYKRMLNSIKEVKNRGLKGDEALLAAFEQTVGVV